MASQNGASVHWDRSKRETKGLPLCPARCHQDETRPPPGFRVKVLAVRVVSLRKQTEYNRKSRRRTHRTHRAVAQRNVQLGKFRVRRTSDGGSICPESCGDRAPALVNDRRAAVSLCGEVSIMWRQLAKLREEEDDELMKGRRLARISHLPSRASSLEVLS